MTYKSLIKIVIISLSFWSSVFSQSEQSDRLLSVTVHSPSLERNLLGDSPDRKVIVYLPPGYHDEENRGKKYPVIYLLHGYDADYRLWTSGEFWLGKGWSIANVADYLIEDGTIQPMLIVMPSAKNRYGGSWYVNSGVAGGWEDFIAQDLISEIDKNYRTVKSPLGRGVAGHSMGGFGALWIGLNNPDKFGAIYGMSTAEPDLSRDFLESHKESMLNASKSTGLSSFDTLDFQTRIMISKAAAFSPNAQNLPFMGDLPYAYENGEEVLKEAVWEKWLTFSLTNDDLLIKYTNDINKINGHPKALKFGLGSADRYVNSNKRFSVKLKERNIDHQFEVYDGDHLNRIHNRITKSVLPFFSANLTIAENESKGIFDSRYSLLYQGTALLLLFLLIRRMMGWGRRPNYQDEEY
ncbi:MAG: hypothetical protein IIA58_05530 [Candidatus Marinimicrobia bacterium]|nr:hypothetical protein [Candidatus Neomarinimicrobiota bacterium]